MTFRFPEQLSSVLNMTLLLWSRLCGLSCRSVATGKEAMHNACPANLGGLRTAGVAKAAGPASLAASSTGSRNPTAVPPPMLPVENVSLGKDDTLEVATALLSRLTCVKCVMKLGFRWGWIAM